MANVTVTGPFEYNFNTVVGNKSLSSFNTGSYTFESSQEYFTVSFDGGRSGPALSIELSQKTSHAVIDVDLRGSGLDSTDVLKATSLNFDSVLPLVLRGNDTISGGGNLYGGGGNDLFNMAGTLGGSADGGSGTDTLQIDPGLTVKQIGESRFAIAGTTSDGRAVTIAAYDMERIKVGTDVTAFDISGNAGQGYRLYQAAFARTPDTPGLSLNVNVLDKGASLHDLAASFLGSPEFTQRYGANLSNTDFVAALYQNALHRAPDAAG